jgi:hypothetical protein
MDYYIRNEVLGNRRGDIEYQGSQQQILLLDLEAVQQLAFDLDAYEERLRSEVRAGCHVVLQPALQLVLPV